ncbi:histamine H3 receptor-like [Saccostrea echinata]|uniref:histamine H3 receptor-like n=1 Tax=Saccostrea echinata TaxID=191078 RepID=UPI002A7EB012|nr:histamine H3 receptor-like [Saccostrea echinata]
MNISNLTSEEEGEEDVYSLGVTIPFGIIIVLLIFFAIFGNAMTIAAFIRDKGLRNVYNMYLVNLAVTDFMLGLISMPFYAVYTLKSYVWPFDYHFCKVYMIIDFALCLESVLAVIIISLDRLLLLKHGPHYDQRETSKVAIVKISLSWVLAVTLYTPAIIGWDLWTGENTVEPGDCDVQFAYDLTFTTSTATVEFVIPFIVIGVLNLLIYMKIRSRRQLVAPASNGNTSTNNGEQSRNRKDLKAARFLAMLVIVFGLTWAPYTISTIIISFCESCVNEHLYEALNWLLWSKASLNPFLYAYNSARFLKNFKEMLLCGRKRKNVVSNIGTVSNNKTEEQTA